MSCIVAVTDGKKIWMGADSAGTSPNTLDQVSCKTPKIYKEGDFIIGTVGCLRGMQLMQNYLDMEERGEAIAAVPEATPFEIVSGLVEDMRQLFSHYGYTQMDSGKETGGNFLIGYRGSIFLVQPEYDIIEPGFPYYSVGNGDSAAFGVLYATRERRVSPKDRVIMALEAAEMFNAAVRRPWVIESVGG